MIEGELQNNNYEDKNGTKHYSVQIIVNQIEFAESKSSQDNTEPETTAPVDNDFVNVPDGDMDELPFA